MIFQGNNNNDNPDCRLDLWALRKPGIRRKLFSFQLFNYFLFLQINEKYRILSESNYTIKVSVYDSFFKFNLNQLLNLPIIQKERNKNNQVIC